jgi:hypothetical protein
MSVTQVTSAVVAERAKGRRSLKVWHYARYYLKVAFVQGRFNWPARKVTATNCICLIESIESVYYILIDLSTFLQLRQVPNEENESRPASRNYGKVVIQNEGLSSSRSGSHEAAEVLEGRIAFLTSQHEKMLSALHEEVEQLKRKNKGL